MTHQLRNLLGGFMKANRRDKAIEALSLFGNRQAVSAVERLLCEIRDDPKGLELTRTLELAEKAAPLEPDRVVNALLSLLARGAINLDDTMSLRRSLNRIKAAPGERNDVMTRK